MSKEERLARINENRMGLNLHLAIKRGLEQQAGAIETATWKANETVILEFKTRIEQLQGKQKGHWITVDRRYFVEVLPETDEKTHLLGDECWCNPKVEQTEGVPLITHYSLKESEEG